jgi:hypothetical protein
MINKVFGKILALSFASHLAAFGVFSLSFGPKIPSSADYARISFLGGILDPGDFIIRSVSAVRNQITQNIKDVIFPLPEKIEISTLTPYYEKPLALVATSGEKKELRLDKAEPALAYKLPPQSIMFYPQLPYYFQIYFKDRQRARIELMFNVVDQDNKNIVMVKRKISSGNLEADLLSMRYIGHYLSIQQAGLPKNNWQSIKIELSAKDPSQ